MKLSETSGTTAQQAAPRQTRRQVSYPPRNHGSHATRRSKHRTPARKNTACCRILLLVANPNKGFRILVTSLVLEVEREREREREKCNERFSLLSMQESFEDVLDKQKKREKERVKFDLAF